MAVPESQEQPNGTAVHDGDNVAKVNGDAVADQEPGDHLLKIKVKLPHSPYELELQVAPQEQVQDLRASITEYSDTFQYSCFHLDHNGERVNDFVELSDVKDIANGSVVTLYEDPYTEKEARMHMLRIRDLIGASGEKIEPLWGLAAGTSSHDDIIADLKANRPAKAAEVQAMLENYDFTAPPSTANAMPKVPEDAPKTIKSLTLSSWNPPPLHLRLTGHLMYLHLTTLTGANFYITSHVSGFWVNKSGQDKFDPSPKLDPKSGKRQFAHSLLSLINLVAPDFDGRFKELQEFNSQRDPANHYQISNALPAAPWMVSDKETQHKPDPSRTQEMWLNSGNEALENLRDWNEEFQSTKELPKESVQERMFRERITNKLFADYTEAATRGAMLVARGELTPLNPTEETKAQIFLHNNVFYSFGADGMGTFTTEGGDDAARVAVGKDVNGVRVVTQLDIDDLHTPGTVVVDYLGRRIVGQSIVPGIFKQRGPGEHQIDYGGVEGRDVVTTNEAFVKPFSSLSKALHVAKHDVWDKEGQRHALEASVETKGLLGTDGRKYVLDLYRLTPLDVTWLKEHWTDAVEGQEKPKERNYPHRMAVLRQELIHSYYRTEVTEYVSAEYAKRQAEKKEEKKEELTGGEDKDEEKQQQQEHIDISNFDVSFNPDVFSGQVPETDDDKKKWTEDEEKVEELCKFLRETAIPALLRELKDGDLGTPMDGQALTRLLHKRGINIRYLGHITNEARKQITETDKRLQAFVTLTKQEMVTRAFKHIANSYSRTLPAPLVPICFSHLLNCLLGSDFNGQPQAQIDEEIKLLYSDPDLSFAKVTPSSLRKQIEDEAFLRYRFTLDEDWWKQRRHIQLLREVSLKLGLQLKAKNYEFTPSANGSDSGASKSRSVKKREKEKQKKALLREASSSESLASQTTNLAPTTFLPEDIANIVPIVKDSTPRSNLAEEALGAGRLSLEQGKIELGHELLFESMTLHEQVYGVVHPEVARVYHSISMLLYQHGDHKLAVDLGRKSAILSERTIGLDASDTVLSYMNLALFEHANGNSITALRYLTHALDLWKVNFGPVEEHPDAITTINNGAVMLQSLKRYSSSRKWFEKSREVAVGLNGANSVSVATLSFQLAQALALDNASREAVGMMKEARDIFAKELGEDNKNTAEASQWLKQLVSNSVNLARAAQIQSTRTARLGGRANILGGPRVTPQAGQNGAQQIERRVADTRTPEEIARDIEGLGKQAKNKNTSKKSKTPLRRK